MRLVIVSNRLPFTVSVKGKQMQFKSSPGGLTTGLWSYLERAGFSKKKAGFLWVGWPGSGIDAKHRAAVRKKALSEYQACPVFVPEAAMDKFYHGFCNATIWPLFHYFPTYTTFDEDDWQEYRNVNQVFFESVRDQLKPGDVVWVHDYQLMLLPKLIRDYNPNLSVGFFLHIPWPSFEVFQLLPHAWRAEILEGLLGSNLIGFHTHDYSRHFFSSVLRTLGHDHQLGRIALRDREVKVDTFPMGIDFEKFYSATQTDDCLEKVTKLRKKFSGLKIIFSVDRLDYTKGLIHRLQGYDLFLKNNPEWHGKVVFFLVLAPSRTGVKTYQEMKREIDEWVGRIHGRYGSAHWTPILYQYRTMAFPELTALFRACDVLLITPLRDGMNLVAKEFVASRSDQTGVLILSGMAGAAREMSEALIVNPFHHREVARALEQALDMSEDEQKEHNRVLQDRLRRYDVFRWAEEFVKTLSSSESDQSPALANTLRGEALKEMRGEYKAAKRRAILLDYDGTLVSFASTPQKARPDRELKEIVSGLAKDPNNEVTIISGRTRADLGEWFGNLPISLIAEHGAWIRQRGEDWQQTKPVTADWKDKIRPILQLYVDHLPGALLEEKEWSLAWHYRRADPELGSVRAKALRDDLANYTRNVDVVVLQGNKVLEVRNAGINKGAAAKQWLATKDCDFVFAIGDDWTDEDMFRALPPETNTVRVGIEPTSARFRIADPAAVRRLLRDFTALGQFGRKTKSAASPKKAKK